VERLTPGGVAGVAVYRFAAHETAVLAASLAPASALATAAAGRPARATWRLADDACDDVLVVARADGAIEVHAHGGLAIEAAALATFGLTAPSPPNAAMRLARTAIGRAQLELAIEQLGHDFAAELARLAESPLPARRVAVAAALARSQVAVALAVPAPVHLIGRQNAGKSTLFNALLGRERALAGPTAGLTRDVVAESVVLDGYPYVLHDHAGEGLADDAADAAAIARSRAARRDGLRLLVVDGMRGPDAADRLLAADAAVVVASKGDGPAARWPADVPCAGRCAAASGVVAGLQQSIGGWLRAARGLPPAGRVGGFAALDDRELAALRALVVAAG